MPTDTKTTTTSASKSAMATVTKSKSSGPKRSSKSATATATTTTTSASKSAKDETPQEEESMIAGILKLLKDNGITNRIMNKNFVDQIDKMKTMTDEIKSMKESYLKLQQQVDKQESATTTTTSTSKSAMATGSKSAEDKNPQMNSLMASFADILEVVREMKGLILGLSDRIGKVEAKLEGEYIAEELMEVDYAMRSLENDIEEIKINVDKTDSSEIFKELAWREERSKELILFKIDESDSKSWNETKTY
jgi:hypothetical protein